MNYLAERRQEEKERRRAEILDAAENVAGSVGWDELTMDQVARRARLSRALLYVYFQDKVDLMYAICERALSALRERCDEAVANNHTGLERAIAVSRAYLAFSQELPVYFDIMARCELREVTTVNPPPNEAACQLAGNSLQAMMVEVLAGGIQDGSIHADPANPGLTAAVLWGFTHGAIQMACARARLLEYQGVDRGALLEQAMMMLRRSLAAKP
jgi:AcrR family transcriptional regulator